MFKNPEQYSKIILTGVFISLLALTAFIANKYIESGKHGFEMNIALYALCIFGTIAPFLLYYQKMLSINNLLHGFILLLILYVDLFIWILIFYCLSSLYITQKLTLFFIPVGLYLLAAMICLILPNTDQSIEKRQ
jgi:hypothetical protein